MLKLWDDKTDCCGCSACSAICPAGAISMHGDELGFLYPYIDQNKCINCHRCFSVCPLKQDRSPNADVVAPRAFAVKHKSDEIRRASSSGGAFTLLSDFVLAKGGVVYGARFDERFNVVHGRAENTFGRNLFRGSKYAQSDLGLTFRNVKDDIDAGKTILFSGTPCQVAGLKNYLGLLQSDTSKLIMCDLLCRAVASPEIFKAHIQYLSSCSHSATRTYFHRSKNNGWGHWESVCYANGKMESKTRRSQNFKDLFDSNLIARHSCSVCEFAKPNSHVGDITIGDFCGIDKIAPGFYDDLGVSVMLINTATGVKVFDAVEQGLLFQEMNISDVFMYNHSKPIVLNKACNEFIVDYGKYGYEYILKKYCSNTFLGKLKYYTRHYTRTALIKFGLLETVKKLLKKSPRK